MCERQEAGMLRSTVDNYQGREQLHSLCMPEFCPRGVVLLYNVKKRSAESKRPRHPNTIFGTFPEHRPWPLLYPVGSRTVSLAEYTPLRIVLASAMCELP